MENNHEFVSWQMHMPCSIPVCVPFWTKDVSVMFFLCYVSCMIISGLGFLKSHFPALLVIFPVFWFHRKTTSIVDLPQADLCLVLRLITTCERSEIGKEKDF